MEREGGGELFFSRTSVAWRGVAWAEEAGRTLIILAVKGDKQHAVGRSLRPGVDPRWNLLSSLGAAHCNCGSCGSGVQH